MKLGVPAEDLIEDYPLYNWARLAAEAQGAHALKMVKVMKLSHKKLEEQKQFMLNSYITYCAIKIQKVFRGYLVRRYKAPLYKALGKDSLGRSKIAKLEAVALGWRDRRINRLK